MKKTRHIVLAHLLIQVLIACTAFCIAAASGEFDYLFGIITGIRLYLALAAGCIVAALLLAVFQKDAFLKKAFIYSVYFTLALWTVPLAVVIGINSIAKANKRLARDTHEIGVLKEQVLSGLKVVRH